jgi:hypothetical protein
MRIRQNIQEKYGQNPLTAEAALRTPEFAFAFNAGLKLYAGRAILPATLQAPRVYPGLAHTFLRVPARRCCRRIGRWRLPLQ